MLKILATVLEPELPRKTKTSWSYFNTLEPHLLELPKEIKNSWS